jgi:hypothetical protein
MSLLPPTSPNTFSLLPIALAARDRRPRASTPFVRAASSSAVSLPISLPFPAAPFFFPGPLLAASVARRARPRPQSRPPPRAVASNGALALAPARAASPLHPVRHARPPPGAAPACAQLAPDVACSRRTVRPLRSVIRPPGRCGWPRRGARCSVHSPSLPGTRPSAAHPLHISARGVLPARCSAWPGATRGGLAQAQLVAARCPGAARPPSWCAGCPTPPRPAHGVFARFALPPARRIALRHACDEPVYPLDYPVYPPAYSF